RRVAAGLPAAAELPAALRRAAAGRARPPGDHGPLPDAALEVVDPLRVLRQPAHAPAVPRRPGDLDEPGRRRPDRRRRQRLDRGLQPQRGRGLPGRGDPPDAPGHRVHVPRQGPAPDDAEVGGLGLARRQRQLPDPAGHQADPPDRRLRPAVLGVQLLRADRQPAGRDHRDPPPRPGGRVLMRVMANVAMVMNLDKCIGCHTCSVTCKQVWTNRPGTEYVYFNNVETRPGTGYPRRYEDQEQWKGGWTLDRGGRLQLRAGGRLRKLLSIFYNPHLPSIDDYGDPWTYDYQTVIDAPLGTPNPSVHSISALTGRDMTVKWGSNFDDDLAGAPEHAVADPNLAGLEDRVKMEFEQVFMFYLPRICEHCLNPSCVASCPSGAVYKRAEDGIVLVDQDRCRGWRFCVSGCPYKKVYFNHRTGKAEKCTFCFPRIEAGQPTVCSETCVGRLRYLGLFLDPNDPEVAKTAAAQGIPHDWIQAAQRSPVYELAVRHRVALPLHPEYR